MARASANRFPMIAKTLLGMEKVLAAELVSLGAKSVVPQSCAVAFEGDMRLLYSANLWCRTATRILLPIKTFHSPSNDVFYREVRAVDWSQFIGPDRTLAVDAFVRNSLFDNSLFAAQLTKDAICDQFQKNFSRRPSVDIADPHLLVNVYIKDNVTTISLDSSGDALNRRTYRPRSGEAPINEILAAGIIYMTKWDTKEPFLDAMCGSGTFIIEAALMARRIAPGLLRRRFGFMNWKTYEHNLMSEVRRQALESMWPDLPGPIIGSDIRPERIREARENAERAGVLEHIRLEQKSFEEQAPPPGPGVLVINPPYDRRMAVEDPGAFYKMIGDTLKKSYQGYKAYIFTGSSEGARHVGLRTSRRIKLFNGPIECRLLHYDIFPGTHRSGLEE